MTDQPTKSHQATGLLRLIRALKWSLAGLKAAFQYETAFRQEVLICIVLAPLGLWLGENPVEKYLLAGSLLLVLIIELINSAIEAAVDRISDEIHPLAARAKDMGSAAVFRARVKAGLIWTLSRDGKLT